MNVNAAGPDLPRTNLVTREQFEARAQHLGRPQARENREAPPEDGVVLRHLPAAEERAEAGPAAPEARPEAFAPTESAEFQGAREKLDAAVHGAPTSLLHGSEGRGDVIPSGPGADYLYQEDTSLRPSGFPGAPDASWTSPGNAAAMLVNPAAGATRMATLPVPQAPARAEESQSWGSRLLQGAKKFWDFGMQGGVIGHAMRKRAQAHPPAPQAHAGGFSPPMAGTGMAPPMITGMAAQMLAANPNLTPAQVHDILTRTADPRTGMVNPEMAFRQAAGAGSAAPTVRTHVGDITQVRADGLIANINTGGVWWGGVDGAIQGVAGDQYHGQAQQRLDSLKEGDTLVARGQAPHRGAFKDVVFVMDDGRKPLREVVLEGLRAADRAGMQSVSLPAMRTGVMAGPQGPGPALADMAAGIKQFLSENPQSLRDIQVVVYKDPNQARMFEAAMAG